MSCSDEPSSGFRALSYIESSRAQQSPERQRPRRCATVRWACYGSNSKRPEQSRGWSPVGELLLELLISEEPFAEAWKVARGHGCSKPQLLALANASERSHPEEALATYAQDVERLAGLGGQTNYEEASKMIARMQSIHKRLGANEKHAAFLAGFMSRHKAKRNLMKLLQPRLPS